MQFSLRKWFRSNSQRTKYSRFARQGTSRFLPRLEVLEGRALPSTVTWINPSGGDWKTASNWSTGSLPTAADDVQINTTGITVTHSALRNDAVHSLTSQAAINVTGGQLSLGAASTIASTLGLSSFGTISGPGNLVIKGLFTWTGGTMSGTGTTFAQGGILLNGSSSETLDVRTLNNPGHALWTGNNNIGLSDGAVINNLATGHFTVQNNQNLSGNGVFNNLGTFTKSIAVSTTTISTQFNNSGTVQISTGALDLTSSGTDTGSFTLGSAADMLEFTGGTTTLKSASNISGPGAVTFNSNATVLGTYNVTGSTTVNGGTVNFAGNLMNAGSTVTISGGTANFAQNLSVANLSLTNSTLTGWGDITVTSSLNWSNATMSGAGSTTVGPAATMTISGVNTGETLDTRVLNNAGHATWNGTNNLNLSNGAVFNNEAGATFTALSDQQLAGGSGTFNNQGAFVKSSSTGTTTIQPLFNNTGTLTINSGTILLSGVVRGSGAYSVASATSTINIGSGHDILGKISGSGSVVFSGGIFSSADVSGQYSIVGTTTVTGTNVEFLAAAHSGALTNTGTVTIGTGITLTVVGNYTQTSGATILNGATLQATNVNINGGDLSGLGSIKANVTNAGTFDVGGSGTTGFLSITGNYTQSSGGVLNIEIGGNTTGTQFDQLAVTGIAALNGTLNVNFINGFAPTTGSWAILTYASHTGTFSTTHIPSPFTIHYNLANATIS
jgi:hypothetical protein